MLIPILEDTIVEHSTLMTYYFAKILPFGNRFHVLPMIMMVSLRPMEQDAVESHSTVFFLGTVLKILMQNTFTIADVAN